MTRRIVGPSPSAARSLALAEEGGPIQQVNEQAEVMMGRSVPLAADGRPAMLIRSSGASCGARMTTIHTEVEFNDASWPAAGPAPRQFALLGKLRWGSGTAAFTADVDVHQGSAFSMVASFVEFDVGFDPASPREGRINSTAISAGLVWGTRPGRPLPTRTLRAGTIAADSFFTFRVPQWAYAVQFHTPTNSFYSEALAAVTITFHSGPLVTDEPILVLAPADVGFAALTFDGVKLSEGVHYITVANAAGEPPIVDLRAMFPLNL